MRVRVRMGVRNRRRERGVGRTRIGRRRRRRGPGNCRKLKKVGGHDALLGYASAHFFFSFPFFDLLFLLSLGASAVDLLFRSLRFVYTPLFVPVNYPLFSLPPLDLHHFVLVPWCTDPLCCSGLDLFLDLLVQYGLDFKRLALAMPGRSSHDLEKWYHTNQQKLKLNEAWQERVTSKAAEAAAGGHPYTITQSAAPTPTLMGSLSWVHEDGTPRPSSSASGSSGGGVRPDYPMAIPYKPRSVQTAIEGSSLPSNIAGPNSNATGMVGYGPVHSGYHHTPYGPSVSMPPYAYAYPPHHSPYYAAHTTYGAPAYTPMGYASPGHGGQVMHQPSSLAAQAPGDAGHAAAAGMQGGFGEAGDSEERSEHKAS